jgi:transcriptional regulator with XRE-family HTH domain
MRIMRFREVVAVEFARRRQHNQRYSLRAFARALGVHHATLSRLLNGEQPVQARTIQTLGARLRLSSSQLAAMVALEDAAAVFAGIGRSSFRPNSRWLASVAGISVDRVNIAVEFLLRSGRLRMPSATCWQLRP